MIEDPQGRGPGVSAGRRAPVSVPATLDLTSRQPRAGSCARKTCARHPQGGFVSFMAPRAAARPRFAALHRGVEHLTGDICAVSGMTPDAARRGGLCYVFPGGGAISWRPIGRNDRAGGRLKIMGIQGRTGGPRGAGAELVDLAGFENRFPWQLSGGMHLKRARSPGRWPFESRYIVSG